MLLEHMVLLGPMGSWSPDGALGVNEAAYYMVYLTAQAWCEHLSKCLGGIASQTVCRCGPVYIQC